MDNTNQTVSYLKEHKTELKWEGRVVEGIWGNLEGSRYRFRIILLYTIIKFSKIRF